MTRSTIEVQIDRHAFEARGTKGDQAIKKFAQARKQDQRLREAQLACVGYIERRSDDQMLDYLKSNSDLMVSDITDTNGKTLLHECTFNDNFKAL